MGKHRTTFLGLSRILHLRSATAAVLVAGAFLLLAGNAPAHSSSVPPVGWSQGPSLPGGFTPRWDFATGAYPPAGQMVLFGGAPTVLGQPWRNDTWVYQDDAWTTGPAAPAGLKPRGGATMAFDPDIGKLVLFGGLGTEWPAYNDTWLYDGSSWTPGPSAPTALYGRSGARMVYDDKIHRIVLFGGSGIDAYTDTWLFDGSSWSPGPAAPPGMGPRANFGMAYDPGSQSVMMLAGNGASDTWLFDGTSWSRGADLPAELAGGERLNLAYNPQLGGMMIFGGIGGGASQAGFHLLRNGVWTMVPKDKTSSLYPPARLDAATAWLPQQDAFMMFSGISDDGKDTSSGFGDSWFFRDVPPQIASLELTPTNPIEADPLQLTTGATSGGYSTKKRTYVWYVNGVQIPFAGTKLTPSVYLYGHGDQIQAKVRAKDALNVYGAWTWSNIVSVQNRPPVLNRASFGPLTAYDTSTFTASAFGTDPEDDALIYHYAWTVNASPVSGNDRATLAPSNFEAGDVIGLSVTIADSFGATGNTVAAPPVAVRNSLVAESGTPGKPVKFTVKGFKVGENVEIRVDSVSGLKLGSDAASDGGYARSFTLPVQFPGGLHPVFAVGLTSGLVGPSQMLVTPSGALSVTKMKAGDPTTYSGVGFIPGEQVVLTFPGAAPVSQLAASNGSVSANLIFPPEPFPGGTFTASAPSGSTLSAFTVTSVFTSPATGVPGSLAHISLSGFGAAELINVSFDALLTSQAFIADVRGSLEANVLLSTTFGQHQLKVTGVTSRIVDQNAIQLQQSLTLSPGSGRVGAVVTIDSGPGWIPGGVVHVQVVNNVVKDVVADPSGSIHTTITVPQHAPGIISIKLISDALGLSASANFEITS